MKGFHTLIMLGVVLVTLLVVIDMIDAGKKETKKREIQDKNMYQNEGKNDMKFKKSGSHEPEKIGKLEKLKPPSGEGKFVKHKINEKKNSKKDSKNKDRRDNPKITKTYQKVKKYKVVEDGPAQKFASSKTKLKTIKSERNNKQETIDEIVKSLKKTSQKKLAKEKQHFNKELVNEELNNINDEETIVAEEETDNAPRRRIYKLIEDELQNEDGEIQEGNETVTDSESDDLTGIKRTESEEVIEKYQTTQTLKLPKGKTILLTDNEEDINEESANDDETLESELSEELYSDVNSFSSRYDDPNEFQRCKPFPVNPNREGPKKLTLYVVEEEVDGQIKKRVISEEDGVTMCEVADLLQEHYYSGLP